MHALGNAERKPYSLRGVLRTYRGSFILSICSHGSASLRPGEFDNALVSLESITRASSWSLIQGYYEIITVWTTYIR